VAVSIKRNETTRRRIGRNDGAFSERLICYKLQCDPDSQSDVFSPGTQIEVCGQLIEIPRSTCGVGTKQLSDLFLDWNRIPKRKDISRTIAGEIVVSKRLAELFSSYEITGAEFRRVRRHPASSAESKDRFQLIVPAEVEIVPPTKAGSDPFDDDPKGEYRCPFGHVIGLNLLSEVSIRSATRGSADIVCTRQFIGVRRGLLRPERLFLISPKVWRLLESEKVKGCEVEVAYLI
jgi:hypothetical protein